MGWVLILSLVFSSAVSSLAWHSVLIRLGLGFLSLLFLSLSPIWRSRAYLAGHPRLRDLGGNMVVTYYASLVVCFVLVFVPFSFFFFFTVICGEQAGLRGKEIEIRGASWFDLSPWSHSVFLPMYE